MRRLAYTFSFGIIVAGILCVLIGGLMQIWSWGGHIGDWIQGAQIAWTGVITAFVGVCGWLYFDE